MTDDDILHRLIALNRERAAEEAAGHVRWLRPEFQDPRGGAAAPALTSELDLGESTAAANAKPDWPWALPETLAALGHARPTENGRCAA